MRALALMSGGALAAALTGCAGTLDDPSAYRAYQQAHTARDAGEARDAEQAVADAEDEPSAANDAAPAGEVDAGQGAIDAGSIVVSEAGSASDAGADPEDAQTIGDAAALCNFKALMQTKCGSAACHGGVGSSTLLDLTTDGLAMRLQGFQGSGSCANMLMVDPQNPAQSALYLRVSGTSCGVRMPLGGMALSSEEQECILQWIGKP